MSSDSCGSLIPTTKTKKCIKNTGTNLCELKDKDCNELYFEDLSLFKSTDKLTSCFQKDDSFGCEKKTYRLENTANCDDYTPLISTKKCVLNNDKNICEEQDRTCEEMVQKNVEILYLVIP